MSRTYKLGSKSDMRRFYKDLEKTIMKEATSALMKKKYKISCPHCNSQVEVHVGKNSCPICHKTIDFQLNIKW